MGSSSNKKKKEKKKDFQKVKLKVGKTKAKASNFTDTSFKAKTIVVNQQSLAPDDVDSVQHFRAQLSQAATSRADGQRRDALSYLCNQLSAQPPRNPLGTQTVLARTLPLVTSGSASVRTQLLRLFRAMPPAEVRASAQQVLMYIRTGLTHLSSDVRADTLAVLDWLLDVAADEAVSCPGGWLKTLKSLASVLGWDPVVGGAAANSGGWTSVSSAALLGGADAGAGAEAQARQISVLAKLLQAGFRRETSMPHSQRAYWENIYRVPRWGPGGGSPFAYLNLFGPARDEDGEMYPDRDTRLRVFDVKWRAAVVAGMEDSRKKGGAVGRAAVALSRALAEGQDDLRDATRGRGVAMRGSKGDI